MKRRVVLDPSWSDLIAGLPDLPGEPARTDARQPAHVQPFVYDTVDTKALHFSIGEIQSRMRLQDPYALALSYTRTMMGFLLFHPAPRHIAMVGLGGGSLAKFCFRHLPDARIDVVEINPHVLALRDEFQVPADDERFRVTLGDGADFVRSRSVQPDVLLLDGFDSEGLPPRLSSPSFYDDCAGMLAPGGTMVANLHFGDPGYEQQLARIRRSFGDAVLVVDDHQRTNTVVFARRGPAFGRLPAHALRAPPSLAPSALQQLQAGFALIGGALTALEPAPPCAGG